MLTKEHCEIHIHNDVDECCENIGTCTTNVYALENKQTLGLNIVLVKLNLYVSPPCSIRFTQFKEPSKVAKSIMNFFYEIMIYMNECQPNVINLLGLITTSTA
jgi:hypothetical protein